MNEGLLPSHALGSIQPPASALVPTAPEDGPCWRLAHMMGLCTGAFSFLLGSCLLFPAIRDEERIIAAGGSGSVDSGDGSAAAAELTMLGLQSAWLYIVGSLGFLFVDVQEFFAFTADPIYRANIACSMLGSAAYVVGSVGNLDSIFRIAPLVGNLGFLLGSMVIGCSQTWKLCEAAAAAATRQQPRLPTTRDQSSPAASPCVRAQPARLILNRPTAAAASLRVPARKAHAHIPTCQLAGTH